MSYSQCVPFCRTRSARMVRPFFKWMVSADACVEASVIQMQLAAKVVTQSRIEAHSSNSEGLYPRNESTGKSVGGGHAADRGPGGFAIRGAGRAPGRRASAPPRPGL